MTLPQTKEVIDVCEKHLTRVAAFGTEIEAFLVRYLLVVTCAELEAAVLSLVVDRARRTNDNEVTSFIEAVVGKQFRRLRTAEMGGLLGFFDKGLKTSFMRRINNTSEQAAFNNIVNNRHNMAHGKATVQMTFSDLKTDCQHCSSILDAFADALGV